MKKSYLYYIVFFLLGSMLAGNISAQEIEKKVHLKVVKNGKTTIDTSFAAENMDKDEIQKRISDLTDIDVFIEDDKDLQEIHAHHHGNYDGKGHKVVVIKSGSDDEDEDGKSQTYVYSYITDDDSSFTMNADSMIIIDADTIVLKKDGDIFVMRGDDDKDFEWIEKESDEGKEVIKSEENEMIIMSTDEEGSSHVKIIKIENGDTVANTEHVTYTSENEGNNPEQKSNNTHIVVIDKNNGTGFVNKEVKIIKSGDNDEGDVEITVTIESGEKGKIEK